MRPFQFARADDAKTAVLAHEAVSKSDTGAVDAPSQYLAGGTTLIDRAICRAQRHLHPRKRWGMWSHAFLFQGVRADGHHWVMESDLQILRKHIQLGVQENRVAKFHDESMHGSLAVLESTGLRLASHVF